jgi:hypothetical protein
MIGGDFYQPGIQSESDSGTKAGYDTGDAAFR